MEFVILEDSPKKLVAEIKGAGHTLCNSLKTELWKNKHVKAATYSISHPLVGTPKILIETDGEKPKKVLADATAKLIDSTSKLKKEFKKIK